MASSHGRQGDRSSRGSRSGCADAGRAPRKWFSRIGTDPLSRYERDREAARDRARTTADRGQRQQSGSHRRRSDRVRRKPRIPRSDQTGAPSDRSRGDTGRYGCRASCICVAYRSNERRAHDVRDLRRPPFCRRATARASPYLGLMGSGRDPRALALVDPAAARAASAEPAPQVRLALGYAFALGGATCFGIGGVIAKTAFNAGVEPAVLAEWRVLFGFLAFLAIVAAWRPAALRIRRADLTLFLAFGVAGLAGVSLVFYLAIQRIPIGVALVIEYTGPILLLVWARLRGRRVGGRLWLAAALALAGCFFAAGAYDAALRELNGVGLALAAADAVIFALYFALAERLQTRYSTSTVLVWGFGFALVGWSVVRPLWTLPWTTTPPEAYALLAAVVVVATVIPFALTLGAIALIPAARVGLAGTFEPAVAAVAAWVVLGERLEPLQLVGGAIVLAGVVLAQSLRPTAGSV
ncbi:MAG: DMT family transporter [Chloroflexi bacterium]|nr:MAG: DMT family transporter [Chloroflexota bacterium]